MCTQMSTLTLYMKIFAIHFFETKYFQALFTFVKHPWMIQMRGQEDSIYKQFCRKMSNSNLNKNKKIKLAQVTSYYKTVEHEFINGSSTTPSLDSHQLSNSILVCCHHWKGYYQTNHLILQSYKRDSLSFSWQLVDIFSPIFLYIFIQFIQVFKVR